MLILDRDQVGRLAFARLAREGAVQPMGPGIARPSDVPDSRALRELTIPVAVPMGTVVSGLGALWVHGLLTWPPIRWLAVGRRGTRWDDTWQLRTTAGATGKLAEAQPAALPMVIVAPLPRACLDTLRWEEPSIAHRAVTRALEMSAVTPDQLRRALAQESAHGQGFAALVRAVSVINPDGYQ